MSQQQSRLTVRCEPLLGAMSRLESLLAREREEQLRAQRGRSTKRVAADPAVGVADVEKALLGHLRRAGTKDLWSLLVPPHNGPRIWSFKSRPHAGWLSRASAICYDMVIDVARNSKVLSGNVIPAIEGLLKAGNVTNTSGKSDAGFASAADVTLRVLLAWCRLLKTQGSAKAAGSNILVGSCVL